MNHVVSFRGTRTWNASEAAALDACGAVGVAYPVRNRGLLGLKFRRQHRIGRYMVDFYCAELRLVVEVDGGYHQTPEQHARDVARTAALEARGIHVLRVRNSHVTEACLLALIRHYVPPLRVGGEGPGGEAEGAPPTEPRSPTGTRERPPTA